MQSEASERVSSSSERANGQVRGPVLTSLFFFDPDHSATPTPIAGQRKKVEETTTFFLSSKEGEEREKRGAGNGEGAGEEEREVEREKEKENMKKIRAEMGAGYEEQRWKAEEGGMKEEEPRKNELGNGKMKEKAEKPHGEEREVNQEFG